VWLGANDLNKEGTWSWQSSKLDAEYTKFDGDEPNGGFNENCLAMWGSDWVDAVCTTVLNIHLCEKVSDQE